MVVVVSHLEYDLTFTEFKHILRDLWHALRAILFFKTDAKCWIKNVHNSYSYMQIASCAIDRQDWMRGWRGQAEGKTKGGVREGGARMEGAEKNQHKRRDERGYSGSRSKERMFFFEKIEQREGNRKKRAWIVSGRFSVPVTSFIVSFSYSMLNTLHSECESVVRFGLPGVFLFEMWKMMSKYRNWTTHREISDRVPFWLHPERESKEKKEVAEQPEETITQVSNAHPMCARLRMIWFIMVYFL